MAERACGNWLSAYLLYSSESESPDSYHIWIALSCIASAVRRNVWLDQGIYILYPNMFVALVGPPGRTGKSTALRMGTRLIRNIPGVFIGPDACSREQLIREMAQVKYNNQCCLTVHSSEFSSIIDTSGILMVQLLTDLYDCDYQNPTGWKYSTKTQGKDVIINPYLNMVVGTTPTYLAESIPQSVIGHGFTARMVFVYGDEERKQNPYPLQANKDLVQAMVDDLHRLSTVFGEFRWDCDGVDHRTSSSGHKDCGRARYQEFYTALYESPPADHRLEGYHWRKKIHVLKVAMLLSLAERDECILDALVIDKAVQILRDLEPDMGKTFSAVGKYEHASDLERIGSAIIRSGGLSISDIYRSNYFVGNDVELRRILSQLSSMGVMRLQMKNGKEWAVPSGDSLPWET